MLLGQDRYLENSKHYNYYYLMNCILSVQYEEIASSFALQLEYDALLIKLLEKK